MDGGQPPPELGVAAAASRLQVFHDDEGGMADFGS